MRTIIIMLITIYVPLAGGINGGPLSATGETLQTGHAACGPQYEFGTVFVLPDSVVDYAGRKDFVCIDRGSAITNKNLDIALVTPHIRQNLDTAFEWGKRKLPVEIWESGSKYNQHIRQMSLAK